MDEKGAMSNLCKIFYRRKEKEKSVFGCGCLVRCSDQSLKIATSKKIRKLTEDEVFATFVAFQEEEEVKLQVDTAEESEEMGIAYVSFDETALTHRPDGLSMGNVPGIDKITCIVPVMEKLEELGYPSSASESKLYDVVREQRKCTLKHKNRVISSSYDSNKFHLLVLGAPILGAERFEFFGIVDFVPEDDEKSLLKLVYHGGPMRVSTVSRTQPTMHSVSPRGAGSQAATVEAEVHIKCIVCGPSSLSASASLAFKYSGEKLQDLKHLVQEVVLPIGTYVRDVIFGSVTFVVIVTTLEALEEIWKRYKEGQIKHNLAEKIFSIAQDQPGMNNLIVEMSEDEYRKAKEQLTIPLTPVNPSTSVSNSDLSTINRQRYGLTSEISSDLHGSRPTPAEGRSRDIQRETADSARNVLSTDDPLRSLWNYVNFRDAFSNVLDVKYGLCARAKYWPHLAEQFGINQATYDAFSTSDINSPTEKLFEHLEATQPTYTVYELCEDCKKAEACEVSRFVEKQICDGTLSSDDLVSEICDNAPRVLDVVVLKLDRDDNLWQRLAEIKGISKKNYMAFKQSAATVNRARLFFDVLRMQGPEITVGNLKEKAGQLKLENIPYTLNKFEISDTTRLRDLSQRSPDAKSELESFLNNLEKDLWKLAILYQKEGKMEDIDLEMVFRQQQELCNPTYTMMEYVLARLPEFTIESLIVKLWNINRKDCFDIIQPYLRGGKEDIDKITRKLEKHQDHSSEGRKQPSTGDEKPSGVPPSDQLDEGNNQYVPKEPSMRFYIVHT